MAQNRQEPDDSGAIPPKGPVDPKPRRKAPKAALHEQQALAAQSDIFRAEFEAERHQLLDSKEDLAAALAHYRILYDNAPMGYVSLDRQGCMREINQTAARWIGLDRKQLIGKPLANHIVPDDRDAVRSHVNRCAGGQEVVVTEARLDRQHRHPLPVLLESVCRPGEDLYLTTITDLTERHRAQEGLRESEERFRQLAESIHEVFWLGMPDWSAILYISPAYEEIWGRPCEELYEKPLSWLESIVPEDREAVRASTQAWESERPAPVIVTPDFRIVRPDGMQRWISARTFPIVNDRGRLWRIAGICEDITLRKQTEQALQQSETRFRTLVEDAPTAIGIGRNGVNLYANKLYLRLFGYDRLDQTVGRPITDHWVARVAGRRCRTRLSTLAGAAGSLHLRGRRPARDGSQFPAQIAVTKVDLPDGPATLAFITDLTERSSAEETIRQSEEQYRTLFENMLEGCAYCKMVYDDQHRPVDWIYLAVNKVFEPLTGLKNVVGKRVTDIIPGIRDSNPDLFEAYGRVAATGQPTELETYVPVLALWTHVSVFCPAPDHFVAVFERINERRQNEARLAAYQRQLRSLGSKLAAAEENERRRIAADLHDNVVQSLAAARLRLQTVGTGALAPEAAAPFNEALRLLHQAVQDTRSLMFELCPPPLYELGLEAALEWLTEKVQKEHTLAVTLTTEPAAIPLDTEVRGILFRAVRELLQNVVKHAHAQTVEVSVHRQGDRIRVEVRDDGRGFGPKAQRRAAGWAGSGFSRSANGSITSAGASRSSPPPAAARARYSWPRWRSPTRPKEAETVD